MISVLFRKLVNYFRTDYKRRLVLTVLVVVLATTLLYLVGYQLLAQFVYGIVPKAYSSSKCFLTLREIRKMENMIAIFTKVADEHNLYFYIDSGSLLGVVRSRTIIPWDKDIDAVFDESDRFRILDLEPEMARYGIRLFGTVFVWAEDYDKMVEGRQDEVPATMETFPLITTRSGVMVTPSYLKFFTTDGEIQASFFERVQWYVNSLFFVPPLSDREYAYPLRRIPFNRFIPTPEIKKKMMEQDEKIKQSSKSSSSGSGSSASSDSTKKTEIKAPVKKNDLQFYEADEDDLEGLKNWEVMIPVPHEFVKVIESYYGKGWMKEKKWKLDC